MKNSFPLSLWKKSLSVEALNQLCANSAVSHLGIQFVEKGADYLMASLSVDEHTRQPFGVLHGGISAALAETVASVAGLLTCEEHQFPAGIELNISHLQAVRAGNIFAKAIPLHLGTRQQVWQVELFDEQKIRCAVARLTLRLLNKANQR